MADQMIRTGMPSKWAWYAAFGLMTTLVWLYLEILRLLYYLKSGDVGHSPRRGVRPQAGRPFCHLGCRDSARPRAGVRSPHPEPASREHRAREP